MDVFHPIFKNFPPIAFRGNEIFDFHLFEFQSAENEIAGRDFISECLADLADAERDFSITRRKYVFVIGENRLRSFRPEICRNAFFFYGADCGFKHSAEKLSF